jgi:HK97 family phage prohead protease
MKNEKIEKRTLNIENYDEEKGIVEGYAAVFDLPSSGLEFIEIIDLGAITNQTINDSDVFAVIDHDRSKGVLARSRYGVGSLNLTVDGKGLRYQFEIPDTPVGNELKSHLERGEITASSFSFTVKEEEWSNNNGEYRRHVKKIEKIFDVSPVFEPSYQHTDVSIRNNDAYEVAISTLNNIKDKELKKHLEAEKRAKAKIKINMLKNKLNII